MKGYFSLKRYEPFSDLVMFGNLGIKSDDPEQYAVSVEGSDVDTVSRTVAHDVIDHTTYHRTNYWVTYEEEIRALGAACYRNPSTDILHEILDLLGRKELKDPPIIYTNMFYLSTEELQEEFLGFNNFSISKEQARIAINNYNYGYALKSNYFKAPSEAQVAYNFIKDNVKCALTYLELEQHLLGVSCYFDTENHIFRHTDKHWK